MSHLTLYRKYRSQSFSDLVGQGHVVRSLQNALARNTQVQAYLFTGPRGTGKTSTARLLAKALNCENGPTPEPCNACPTCQSIAEGSCFDVIELDAASESGVDDVREKIVEVAEYPPGFCRYRIIILDEVHDLSPKAFDALLKTVEEPPPHLIFILATTEFQKVPPTIRSRCQKFEFHRGSVQEIAARIKYVADAEKIEIEPAALSTLARMADGGFRDALTLLEQAALMADGPINISQLYDQLGLVEETAVDRLLMAVKESATERLLSELDEIGRLGRDPRSIVESMMYRLSDLTRAVYGVDQTVDGASAANLHEIATRMGVDSLMALRSELAQSHRGIKDISLPRIWLEAELIGISRRINAPKLPVASVNGANESPKTAPTVVRSEPIAKTKVAVQSDVVVEPKAQEKTATAIVVTLPEQEETGEEALDIAIRTWKQTVKLMYGQGGSANLASKLASTNVKSFSNGKLIVAFHRNIDFNGITGGPKGPDKKALILEKLTAAGGNGWSLDYIVEAPSTPKVEDDAAVELPAEGKRLHELAKEVFPGS